MLFPSTADHDNIPQARRLSNSVQQRVTSRTLPNQANRSASYSPGQISQQYHRRPSTQQLSVSPIQNPRVSGLVDSSSSSSSQGHSNVSYQQQRFYASSAPSSSASLKQQGNSPRNRPPVPLFSNTTSKSQTMAHTPFSQSEGKPIPNEIIDLPSAHQLTIDASDFHTMDFDLADLTSASGDYTSFFDESLDLSQVNSFDSAIDHPASTHTSPQTISPKDILIDYTSAPPSTTFTNLTTPGTNTYDSPSGAYSTGTSPLFGEDELDDGAKHWPSLFEPLEEQLQAIPMAHTISSSSSSGKQSLHNSSPMLGNSSPAPYMSRNDSSPGHTTSKTSRHSFTSSAGVRKREKPLPPIHVDENDSVAVKRARNTMAARKSRQKRMERTETLENTIADLREEVRHWKQIAIDGGHVE